MKISRVLIDAMVAHALAEAPLECVGLVAAEDGVAVQVYRLVNAFASEFRYTPDGREYVRAFMDIEDRGWSLGAIYHSHTRSAPVPSQTDINEAMVPGTTEPRFPETLHIIVGVAAAEPEVRAYHIRADGYDEVALGVEG
jgi:proteasome lid subunit RPN8/RPN11